MDDFGFKNHFHWLESFTIVANQLLQKNVKVIKFIFTDAVFLLLPKDS